MKHRANYQIKGETVQELQYFYWIHTIPLQKVIIENSRAAYSPAVSKEVKEFCFISRGKVYYGTVGQKAQIYKRHITYIDLDNDPLSTIEPLEGFRLTRPQY